MGSTSGKRVQAGVLTGILALVSLFGVGCSSPAPGGSPGDSPRARGRAALAPRLRVATSGDYAPESVWPDEAAEPSGHSVELARAFAAASGREIEWVRLRWPALAEDLERDRFDVALSGVTIRSDRAQSGRFSLPTATSGAVVLVLETSPLAGPEDLARAGLRLAVNRGGHLERVARRLFPDARIEPIDENARVPERLARAEADAILTDSLEAPRWQERLPPTRAIGPLTQDRKAALFPASQTALARAFDRWLLEAEASGLLRSLRARYGLDPGPTADPTAALLARLDERLALAPAVAVAKRILARPIFDPAQEARVRAAARRDADAAAEELGASAPPSAALAHFVDALLSVSRAAQSATAAAGPDHEESRERARSRLETQLRPAIAYQSERLVWLVVACRARRERARACPAPSASALADLLARHSVDVDHATALHAALEAAINSRPDPSARAGE